jgi:outer membrane protein assembly factor BamB
MIDDLHNWLKRHERKGNKTMIDDLHNWQHDAILRNWRVIDYGTYQVVSGVIYEDGKNRFRDGEQVRTSYVVKIDGDKLWTRNTKYLLQNPLPESKSSLTLR